MAISFMRCDYRVIHGQIVVRWSKMYPSQGIIAVDDASAKNPVVKQALKAACPGKNFVWTYEKFCERKDELTAAKNQYFLITKTPVTMARILVDADFDPGLRTLNIGPQAARPNTVNVGKNADLTPEEGAALERIWQAGYKIEFQLTPDLAKVDWADVRGKFVEA